MKKILISAFTLGLIVFTSCQKDYACDCTTTTTTTSEVYDEFFGTWETTTTTTTTDNTYNFKAKKSEASSICSGYNNSTSSLDVTSNTACTLR